MKNDRTSPKRKKARRGGQKNILLAGWIFLGIMIAAAVVVIILLIPKRNSSAEDETTHSASQLEAGSGGSAFQTEQTAAPIKTGSTGEGRLVSIGRIETDYTPPESVTVGVLKNVDLVSVGETVAANIAANGWGSITYSVSDNGSLLLQSANQTKLTPDSYEKQEEFLASSQPEAAARTFLEHSCLVSILANYGLTLNTTDAENNNGEITFRGTGSDEQSECSVRFSFLYTGDFNQAVVRAVYLDGAVQAAPISLKKACSNAVSWNSAEGETTSLTGAELRSVRGLPFYVLTCADGTVAYSLAVEESVLDSVSGAREIYENLMSDGIQQYTEISGTE